MPFMNTFSDSGLPSQPKMTPMVTAKTNLDGSNVAASLTQDVKLCLVHPHATQLQNLDAQFADPIFSDVKTQIHDVEVGL
jgi:hypothetical protein